MVSYYVLTQRLMLDGRRTVTIDDGEKSNVVVITPKTVRLLSEKPLQSALSKRSAHCQCSFDANSI